MNGINHWIPKKKKSSADWYKSIGSAEKQNLLSNRAIWFKSMDTTQKKKREQNGLTHSILHKNRKEQNGISH